MKPLVEQLAASLGRLVSPESRGVIAVSGGADSVALARLSCRLRDRSLFSAIVFAHLNHQLRGPESDGDEAFVLALGDRWDVRVETERINVAARAEGRNLEETARAIRYEWLTDVARRHDARWIATAHTADDQAETVLHHFLRGSGLAGLSGIAERRPLAEGIVAIRPLLSVRRSQLHDELHIENIEVRDDSSNADLGFTRNRLRHVVIPILEREVNPGLTEVLVRAAEQARDCQAAVTEIAEAYLLAVEKPKADGVLVFSRQELAKLAPFWVREVFRIVWRREGWPMGLMNADDWRRFNGLVDGTLSAHDFPRGVRGRSQRHVVQLWRESDA